VGGEDCSVRRKDPLCAAAAAAAVKVQDKNWFEGFQYRPELLNEAMDVRCAIWD
jgi:hypothetical protein